MPKHPAMIYGAGFSLAIFWKSRQVPGVDLFSMKPQSAAPKALSVTQLLRRMKNLLEVQLGEVWVEGEVSNLRKQGSALRNSVIGVQNCDFGLRNSDTGAWNCDFGLRNSAIGVQNCDFRVRNSASRVQNCDFGLRNRVVGVQNCASSLLNSVAGVRNCDCRVR